jgi:hypothetical protein
MIIELAFALFAQDSPRELKHAAELMERSTEQLHRAGRPPKAEDPRAGTAAGSLDLSIERQKAALEIVDELLKAIAKKGN